jgi:hypothetical protein
MSSFQPISGFQISEFGILLPLPAIPKERLMHTITRLLCLLPMISSAAAMADTYPKRTLVAGSMVCYKAGDWTKMVEASLDQDEDEAERLIGSGKCRTISTATKVSFIEGPKDGDKSALIQLPSGKTAMTANGWLR